MTDMTARAELRRRIVRRLSTDEWMERHFGIVCHAGDVADAVLELFDDAVTEYVRLSWSVLPVRDLDGDHVRYVLRTAPEPVLAGREAAIDAEAAQRALADPAPSIPLDEVLTLADEEGER